MNKDFPRVLKLLREERGLKQKDAADRMGIAQALLSHYENGKRECGLDFLVQASDFYGVSVDYLLGRTSSHTGTVISEEELPESSISESSDINGNTALLLRKKLITNSLEVIFSLMAKAGNPKLSKSVASYIMTGVYRAYRMVFSAGGQNDEKSFSIPADEAAGLCAAKNSVDEIRAKAAAGEGSSDARITNARIEQEYPKQSAALFSVITNAERELKKFDVE